MLANTIACCTVEPEGWRPDLHGMSNGKHARRAVAESVARSLDRDLDRALEGTFPASDPVAIGGATSTEAPSRPIDRRAPEIDLEAVGAARAGPRRRSAKR
jgi:hypothetical protein